MRRVPTIAFCLLTVAACSSKGSDGDSGGTGGTAQTCAAGAGTFMDPAGDVPSQLIDITSLTVTVTGVAITAEINLVHIPALIDYNDPATPDNAREYGWEVRFDVNGDGDCFSAGDVELAVLYFKPPLAAPATNQLLTLTQYEAWRVGSSGIATILTPINASVLGDTLTLNVLKGADPLLQSVTSNTPVRIETTYVSAGTELHDRFPN